MIHYHLNYLVNKLDNKIDDAAQQANVMQSLRSTLEILYKYDVDSEVKNQITSNVKALSARYDERRLFVGVIGESSSGKSTFINALIEEELLESDIIIGTTAVPTMLMGQNSFDIIARLKDGRKISFIDARNNYSSSFYDVREQIAAFIHHMTADPVDSAQVCDVTIYRPYARILSNDIVLVDTPGISDLEEHRDVVRRAIQYCDAAIIIIDMSNPLSSTLTHFIRDSASEILENTIYVLTRADQAGNERETELLISHLQEKIKNEFGAKAPIVEPCAPYQVVEHIKYPGVTNRFVEQFDDLRLKVKSFFHDRKKWIKNFNEISNLLPIYDVSIKTLEKARQEYDEEIKNLQNNPIKDLDQFKIEEKTRQTANFPPVDYNEYVRNKMSEAAKKVADNVQEILDNATTGKELETRLAPDIERYCISENMRAVDLFTEIIAAIEQRRESRWQQFKNDFEHDYPGLITNQMPFEKDNEQDILVTKLSKHKNMFSKDIKRMIDEGIAENFLSKIKSLFIKPKIEEYRKKYRPITMMALDNYNSKVYKSMEKSIDKCTKSADTHLAEAFKANYDIYTDQIEKRIQKRRERIEYLTGKAWMIRADIDELQKKLKNLQMLKELMLAIK